MASQVKGGRDWRDDAAGEIMAHCLASLDTGAHLLAAGGVSAPIAAALHATSTLLTVWQRRIAAGEPAAAPWPAPSSYTSAAVRLPRAREELVMTLHAVASVLAPGGRLWLYGANDEGIRSTTGALEALFGPVHTVATRRHCRVLEAVRPGTVPGLKAQLADWRSRCDLLLPGGPVPWVSYPGVFAHGRLDVGTALLLSALPLLRSGARVLDFACGSGLIGYSVLLNQPAAAVDFIDADTVALAAAAANVPQGRIVAGNGIAAAGAVRYDAIVSNPPLHAGKQEDHGILAELIAAAPACLVPAGLLQIVVQRRVPVEPMLKAAFGQVERIAQSAAFWVFRASHGRVSQRHHSR